MEELMVYVQVPTSQKQYEKYRHNHYRAMESHMLVNCIISDDLK